MGEQEIRELLELKKHYVTEHSEKCESYMDRIAPWDCDFYTRLALDKVQVDHDRTSEYFPLQHSISAMLDIFASCFQLRFVPAPSETILDSIWHKNVEAWSVWDKREISVGGLSGICSSTCWKDLESMKARRTLIFSV